MQYRLPSIRRLIRQATLYVPESVVERLPGAAVTRVTAMREWQRDEPFRLPGGHSPLDNVSYNRSLWDWYATKWDDPTFQQRQLSNEGKETTAAGALAVLGQEWGSPEDVQMVVSEWIHPYLDSGSVVGEIGTGGGRVARLVAPLAGTFHAFDVAPKMLERARATLSGALNCTFHVLPEPRLPANLASSFDFIYSFDVFVHLDLHAQWSYLSEFSRVLKPGGKAFVHTSNLASEAGWKRFEKQGGYRVEGFYFVTPETVRELVSRAGLRVLNEMENGKGNFYYSRDYLVLLEKPARSDNP